jgi:protein phosphatase PTC7
MASDGLFDNLFNVKIIELVRPFIRDRDDLLDPALVAEMIAKEAEQFSHNQNYLSPFGKSARDHFYDYRGGKPDDVTVIVAQVIFGDTSAEGPTIKGPII